MTKVRRRWLRYVADGLGVGPAGGVGRGCPGSRPRYRVWVVLDLLPAALTHASSTALPATPSTLPALSLPAFPGPLALPVPDTLPETFRLLDLCGVLLNGILGGLIARRKNFDLVGFVVLAILTATGGGILRDVMIQAGPPFALTDPYYLYTACAGALVAWFVPFTSRLAPSWWWPTPSSWAPGRPPGPPRPCPTAWG